METLDEFLDEIEKCTKGGCQYCCGCCDPDETLKAAKIIRIMKAALERGPKDSYSYLIEEILNEGDGE